ncbi:hypothetical protein KPL70_007788 [Citrus sinensis]|nr:hypothetical protein KPL70_007788 [Citrus sinensis]
MFEVEVVVMDEVRISTTTTTPIMPKDKAQPEDKAETIQDRECRTPSTRIDERVNYVEEKNGEDGTFLLARNNTSVSQENTWYLDTVASNHMSGNRSMFNELNEFVNDSVAFGDDSKVPVKCKQFRKSFSNESNSRAQKPLKFIHTDNSKVFEAFKKFKAAVEKERVYQIKDMRSDRGGEFTSKEFVEFWKANGIRSPFIVSRSPQQDSVAERKNKTIIDMARSMFKSKRLPKEFWAEAVPVNFQEIALDEKWRITMDEEIKSIVKNNTWELTTLPKGHKSAFLNGFLEEEVYIEQQLGYMVKGHEDKVLRLKKALHGLKVKLSKHDEGEDIDPTFFKSLVESLRYLTYTRPDILYAIGLVSRYMKNPKTTHFKVTKRILRYIKGTTNFGLLYSFSNDNKLVGYSDKDWGGDVDDRKSTTGFVLFMGDTTFTWMSKKQPIVTLFTCEVEYVATTSSVCHAIWLRNLLKKLSLPQEEPSEICVDNKPTIALSKNPVFHDRSKHIDTRYHFIRECLARKEVQVKYVKSQDQAADIFTKLLK